MRFLPHTEEERKAMLEAIGVSSVAQLYNNVPEECFPKEEIDLPNKMSEYSVERKISKYADKNLSANKAPFFLGAGCYYHHVPASVDHIIQRSEFLTSYTPYQAEVSQGNLMALFQFQSMIANLTGQGVANASMYDGASATAEAVLMANRINKRHKVKLWNRINPEYKETIETYSSQLDTHISSDEIGPDTSCVVFQCPDFYGNIESYEEARKQCDEHGVLLIVVITEIVSLGLLKPPTDADIVVGEAQSIGVAMQFGGPHLGFFACQKKYVRQMPGRLCGATKDKDGNRSFTLTLNTREQHIRRDRATSNICTNQGLCSTAFTIHLSLLGEEGFKTLARVNHEKACQLADALEEIDSVEIENETFFNEFVVKLPSSSKPIVEKLAQEGIIAGLPLENNRLLVAATEMTNTEQINEFVNCVKKIL